MRIKSITVFYFTAFIGFFTFNLFGQGKPIPYSATDSYKNTISALQASVPSPARAAGSGEIFCKQLTPPDVNVKKTSETTIRETDAWTMTQTAKGVEILNKLTGKSWKMDVKITDLEVISKQVIRIRCQQVDTPFFQIKAVGPFFGGGERFETTNLDGLKFKICTEDAIYRKVDKKQTYAAMGWFFSPVDNIGIYIDTPDTLDIDFTKKGSISSKLYHNAVTDCYIVVAQSPKEILRGLTSIVGRSPIPPVWGLGVWANFLKGRDSVMFLAKKYREMKVPVSAIWIFDCTEPFNPPIRKVGWSLWTKGTYGNIPALNNDIHQLGFKSLTYVKQRLVNREIPTNFRNAKEVDEWENLLHTLLNVHGWDGWMEDFGESAPTFPMEYHKASHIIASGYKSDKVAFSRSGSAGSQAFTQVLWAGDNPPRWNNKGAGLAELLPALYSSGFSGFSVWAPDNLCATTDLELWKRWFQFGALTCVMRDHLWDYKPENIRPYTNNQTLMFYSRYAKLHNSLVPYLMALAREAKETGCPILRHPVLECPNEKESLTMNTEFFIGDRILVAPVLVKGDTTRQFYLPKGEWVNWWTEDLLKGGVNVTVSAPLENIPIFVRAGSVLPMFSDDVETLNDDLANGKWKTPGNRIVLKVFPGSSDSQSNITLTDGSNISVISSKNQSNIEVTKAIQKKEYQIVLPNGKKEVIIDTNFKKTF